MDKTLGYLFDKLIKTNLIEKINIIVLSDHGMTTMQPPEKSLIISDYVDMNLVQTFRTIYGPVSNIHPRNSSSFVVNYLY
jgi:predicted AlkP superfamily pyrophosphatase or phosphodiesterase